MTEAPGQASGIRAQVGFGPDGTQPNASWTWEEMTFNAQAGNNDEYVGSLLPDGTGTFDYATRYSSDGGQTWYLADLAGPQRDGTLDSPGAMTVNASSDATPPSAPVLSLAGVNASSVSLSWTDSTDDVAVGGYEVFRDGVEIAQVDQTTTDYVDESVTTGVSYDYFVKAFDTSFNRSDPSNEVTVTAENRTVQVTFTVGVPAFTPPSSTIHVTGSISQLGPWNPSAHPMTQNLDGTWSRTFEIPDGASFEWKYTRGSWETVENWGSISGLGNRGPVVVDYGTDGTMAIANTATDWGTGPDSSKAVQNWRDPIVVSHTPADDATDVPLDSTVVVTWSKAMAAGSSFSVTGPDGVVAGSFALGNSDMTVTFTPSAPFAAGAQYDVLVSGKTDAAGEVQQESVSFSFTTLADEPAVLESIAVTPANPSLKNGAKVNLTATGTYSDGSTADLTVLATWSTSDKKVADVTAGAVKAKGPGTAVISATLDGVVGNTTVTITPPGRPG